MIKVYGMPSCPYCEFIKPQLDEKFKYVDISTSVRNLKEFVDLRESRKEFDRMKEMDDLGIPCFVKEDGNISFVPEDFGLKELGSGVCSLNDRSGC